MALFIPHRCPTCFESVTLIQPLDREDMPKGKAQGHCVFCGWREKFEMYPNQINITGEGRGVSEVFNPSQDLV